MPITNAKLPSGLRNRFIGTHLSQKSQFRLANYERVQHEIAHWPKTSRVNKTNNLVRYFGAGVFYYVPNTVANFGIFLKWTSAVMCLCVQFFGPNTRQHSHMYEYRM